MCHFITATLPKDTDLGKAHEIFDRHKLRFEEIENDSVAEQLESGDYYILTTQGMCDCGTVLGSLNNGGETDDEDNLRSRENEIAKLKKKGWSVTKIGRWLREAELNREKEERSQELAHQFALTLVTDWIHFITDFLTSKAAARIGILLHMYDGPLNARIRLKGKRRIPLSKMDEATLLQMEEDVIYEFVSI